MRWSISTKRRPFTLLELLLLLLCLSLVGGGLYLSLRHLMIQQTFRGNLDLIAHKIELATELALASGERVALTFEAAPTLSCRLEGQAAMGSERALLLSKSIPLKGINHISLNDRQGAPFTLLFDPAKGFPQVTLSITGPREQSARLFLSGSCEPPRHGNLPEITERPPPYPLALLQGQASLSSL